ncbi:MAG: DUF4389 domain-containing protein [Pseudomonadales bacterium]
MDKDIKESVTAIDTWLRALYMILFAIICSLTEIVLVAVVVLQFFIVLFTREPNDRLLDFGEDIGVFIFQIIQYLTFNTEEKPFPFGPWPYGADEDFEIPDSPDFDEAKPAADDAEKAADTDADDQALR